MSASRPSCFSPQMQGWLLKQRQGLRKSWSRRYFVLEGSTLTYYKQENDTIPRDVLNLDAYRVTTTTTVPATVPHLLKRHSPCQYTFLLTSNDGKKSLFLQAESKEEMDMWLSALEQLNETSVLDKWLERLDMCPASSATPPLTLHSRNPRVRSMSKSSRNASTDRLKPKQRPRLRHHRSTESIASSTSDMSTERSSSIEIHRAPHTPSTPHKRLVSFLHHWPRPKSARDNPRSDSLSSSSSSSLSLPNPPLTATATVVAPEIPIIHPSEYDNHRPFSFHSQIHPTGMVRGQSCPSVTLLEDDGTKDTLRFPRVVTLPQFGTLITSVDDQT